MSRSNDRPPSASPEVPAEALREILDECADGVGVAVPHPWRLVYANQSLSAWLAAESRPWQERPLADALPAFCTSEAARQLESVLLGEVDGATLSGRLSPRDAMPAEIRLCRVTAGGQPAVAIVARRATTAAVPPGTDVDSLTGLPSRSFLLARLDKLLGGERASDEQVAVLFIDLNEFKWVNDTYGHLVGDRALCEVACRLAGCMRDGDHIVRFGGDEFVVLLEHVRAEADIQPVLDRIHAVLRPPIALPVGEVTLTASIGVAEASPAHHNAEDLLAAADLAMYASKRQ